MKKSVFIIIMFFCVELFAQVAIPFDPSEVSVSQVRYYYLASFKAVVGKPKGSGPFPVIIYSYDEIYDWSGKKISYQIGYNLEEFAQYFAKRGYLCIIPLDRFRKLNAVLGVTNFVKKLSIVDPLDINLVGMSEGAFLNLLASQKIEGYKSMVAIAPIMINDKGFLSYEELLYRDAINAEMSVLMLYIYDVGWRIKIQKKMFYLMSELYTDIDIMRYYNRKKWFWDIDRYGFIIDGFIKNN